MDIWVYQEKEIKTLKKNVYFKRILNTVNSIVQLAYTVSI